MKSRITSILFLSLILSLSVACGEKPPGPDDGPGGGDNNTQKHEGICAGKAPSERCSKNKVGFEFSRATYLNDMSFPETASYMGHKNHFGQTMAIGKDTVLNVNKELADTIRNGALTLVAEFDGWKASSTNPPTEPFTVMVWTASQPTAASEVTVNSSAVDKGTASKAFFRNARINGNKLTTEKVRFELPINANGIGLNAVLEEARLEATVTADRDGVKLTDGIIYGLLTKKSIIDGLVSSENKCGTGCIKSVNPDGTDCKQGSVEQCASEGCRSLFKTCSTQHLVGTAFDSKLNGVDNAAGTAVIKISGVPVKITGIQ